MSRHTLPVTVAGREIGLLNIAVSYEVDDKTRQRIEAVPIHIDQELPHTFDKRDNYDALLVDTAIAELKSRR